MGKKFNCDIIAKSTFSNKGGTNICQQIEASEVKSLVKNENLVAIEIQTKEFYKIYQLLLQNHILVEAFQTKEETLQFRIKKQEQNKVIELLDSKYPTCQISQKEIVKLSMIGYGIIQDNQVLAQVTKILKEHQIAILEINLTQSKIEILAKQIEDKIVEQIHEKLIQPVEQ